jgi:tripartite-type tricarboxylate transporter receptor subunit TctC
MKLPCRKFPFLAAAFSRALRVARAQAYPARPVRIVVGYAPGGGRERDHSWCAARQPPG